MTYNGNDNCSSTWDFLFFIHLLPYSKAISFDNNISIPATHQFTIILHLLRNNKRIKLFSSQFYSSTNLLLIEDSLTITISRNTTLYFSLYITCEKYPNCTRQWFQERSSHSFNDRQTSWLQCGVIGSMLFLVEALFTSHKRSEYGFNCWQKVCFFARCCAISLLALPCTSISRYNRAFPKWCIYHKIIHIDTVWLQSTRLQFLYELHCKQRFSRSSVASYEEKVDGVVETVVE